MWPARLEWQVFCNPNYTRSDKVPAMMKKSSSEKQRETRWEKNTNSQQEFQGLFF